MQIIFKIIEDTTIFDIVTVIIALASLLLSIITICNASKESKQTKINRKIDMEANYYSYPVLESDNDFEVLIPTDSKCIISGNIDYYNILNIIDHKVNDNYNIEISFNFKNMSKIFPNRVLVDKLTIFYGNDKYYNQNILKEIIHFESVDNKAKIIYIDGKGNLRFKIKCLIDKKAQEKIINSLNKDNIIQFSFSIKFKNVFDIVTTGKYDVSLKKINVQKEGSLDVIGSNKTNYKFKTHNVQYQNISVSYQENVNKS